jgi:hypothetical protein
MRLVHVRARAVVTPPMISLYWLDDDCTPVPTLAVDTIIDGGAFLLNVAVAAENNFLFTKDGIA